MSHIRRETVLGVDGVSAELLEEGLRIVGALLEMQGVKVTDYFYNYSCRIRGESKGVKIVFGLDAEGPTNRGLFGGIGVGIRAQSRDCNKLLAFLGTSEDWDGSQANQSRQADLQAHVEKLLPGAVYLAARAALARAQGKRAEVRVNPETRELQLVVEV